MDRELNQCSFMHSSVMDYTSPLLVLKIKKSFAVSFAKIISILRPKASAANVERKNLEKREMDLNFENSTLDLEPGEWVEVRSMKEILATLDERGKLKGLLFMPEMKRFCGKKFRVYKRVGKIKLESTGELRKLKTPSIFLDGVFCDGQFHENCQRSCFSFWREAWLKRVPE